MPVWNVVVTFPFNNLRFFQTIFSLFVVPYPASSCTTISWSTKNGRKKVVSIHVFIQNDKGFVLD